jgi:hypothetical protein
VIAEDGIDAEPGPQARERHRRLVMRIMTGGKALVAEKVPGDQHQIRVQSVDLIDDPGHPRRRHVGSGDMQVGYEYRSDRRLAGRPVWEVDAGFANYRVGKRRPEAPADQGCGQGDQEQEQPEDRHGLA